MNDEIGLDKKIIFELMNKPITPMDPEVWYWIMN